MKIPRFLESNPFSNWFVHLWTQNRHPLEQPLPMAYILPSSLYAASYLSVCHSTASALCQLNLLVELNLLSLAEFNSTRFFFRSQYIGHLPRKLERVYVLLRVMDNPGRQSGKDGVIPSDEGPTFEVEIFLIYREMNSDYAVAGGPSGSPRPSCT